MLPFLGNICHKWETLSIFTEPAKLPLTFLKVLIISYFSSFVEENPLNLLKYAASNLADSMKKPPSESGQKPWGPNLCAQRLVIYFQNVEYGCEYCISIDS